MTGVDGYAKDVLAEPDWLEHHLADEAIRVIEVDEDPDLYRESHIPGAIGLDWRVDLQDPVRRRFLGPDAFGQLLGSRGVSNDHVVILYGDRNNWFAAYAYWYFKFYGHQAVKLLSVPREVWIAQRRPISAAVPNHPSTTYVAGPGDESIRITRDGVLRALDSGHVFIDVRSPQEYAGATLEPGPCGSWPERPGHIPGAHSIPWAMAVNEDGSFKPADELRELYGRRGALNGAPVVSYCRIGERSAHTWFVLHELLGAEDVRNYDGSWSEWGNLVDVPIERGSTSRRSPQEA